MRHPTVAIILSNLYLFFKILSPQENLLSLLNKQYITLLSTPKMCWFVIEFISKPVHAGLHVKSSGYDMCHPG